MNYDNYFNKGNLKRADITEFTSANTVRLSVEQVKEKLLELSYVRERLKKWRERR